MTSTPDSIDEANVTRSRNEALAGWRTDLVESRSLVNDRASSTLALLGLGLTGLRTLRRRYTGR